MTAALLPFDEHPIGRYLISQRRGNRRRMSVKRFAQLCGVSRNAVYRVAGGDEAVSPRMFEKFDKATGGALDAVALYIAWLSQRNIRRERHKTATA